jgi:hypothetical protein
MGWLELLGHLRRLKDVREREAGRDKTDPDSWDGAGNDSWWAEQRAKADRMRGRA